MFYPPTVLAATMFVTASLLVSALLLRAPHAFTVSRARAVASAAASAVDVVVVGGGPAGLAAATDLASAGLSVTVVERRETASAFEMQRAYLYLLDRRGQQWTDRHDLTATVRERGVVKRPCGKRGGSEFAQLAPKEASLQRQITASLERQITPQAARSFGPPRPTSRLGGSGRPYRPYFRHRSTRVTPSPALGRTGRARST